MGYGPSGQPEKSPGNVEKNMSASGQKTGENSGQIERPSGLAESVYRRIRTDIMSLKLPPDSRISMDSLARELGVSQTPIREALSMLEANGLVTRKQFSGYCTAPRLTRAQLDELFEFRLLVEPHAARKAAAAMGTGDAARLTETARRMDASRMPPGEASHENFADSDTEFHRQIALGAGNGLIAESLARLHIHVQIFRSSFGRELAAEAVSEHARVLDAILAHDGDAAEGAMRGHIERSWRRLCGLMAD
jgi:DNA-binding GntR family transcriptional regulator